MADPPPPPPPPPPSPPPPTEDPILKVQLPPKTSSSAAAGSSSRRSPSAGSGKHPTYRGIRSRSGKWVSEIREPRKSKRIWLGTYPRPEMAAAAYDVAALSLKGADAVLNFPDLAGLYKVPAAPEPGLIRNAAGAAAALMIKKSSSSSSSLASSGGADLIPLAGETPGAAEAAAGKEFVDEEEFFDMPNMLADMAEGMLMSPPRQPRTDDLSPGDSSDCSDHLWNY
ncbi:hypothetical protein SSX86_032607 [Deinandra increscens subsp. villosa]|uniref:AP2/ERF domain-containing protein n=1 Tax=Deinandra increscens subsp. villosa TaxID=3103831 RepID=A0AAP0C3E8_9ASTR